MNVATPTGRMVGAYAPPKDGRPMEGDDSCALGYNIQWQIGFGGFRLTSPSSATGLPWGLVNPGPDNAT